MMQQHPQQQHHWLHQLIGEWTFESECVMGPDQPPMRSTGKEVVRSLGGLWTIGEGEGSMGEGTWKSLTTLGFDLRTQHFVGTFMAGMMTHLWSYTGYLDATGKILTLDTLGPNFTDGSMSRYRDIYEIIDANNRILRSEMLFGEGQWIGFMKAHYRRTA
jgi:hypothetical protein